MEPSRTPENSEGPQPSLDRERNRSYQHNWRQRFAPERAAQNRRQRHEQEQLRIQNMSEEERNARLQNRRRSQRLRRATLQADQGHTDSNQQQEITPINNLQLNDHSDSSARTETFITTTGRGVLTNLDGYATNPSTCEQGSSSNSRQPDMLISNISDSTYRTTTTIQTRGRGVLANLDGYAIKTSTCERGSSSNSIHPAQNRIRNIPRRPRVYGIARNYVQYQHVDGHRLCPTVNCLDCGAKLFKHETMSLCCNKGTITFEPLISPPEMLYLFADQTTIGRHFRHYIRAYNHVFSFTSMGVHVDEEVRANAQGLYTFRAQGAIYHKIGNLLPDGSERPRFLQLYVFDTEHELQNRMNENDALKTEVIQSVTTILNLYNPFVHIFRHMANRPDLRQCRLKIKELPPNRRQYDLPSASEVSAILVGGEEAGNRNERDIVVQAMGGKYETVKDTAGYYDPLQYPVLFPYGTYGWTYDCTTSNGRDVTCCDFYSYRLMIRPNDRSVLLRGGRLLQQYVVDMYVKIESNKLRWVRLNQEKIRSDSYKGLRDAILAGDKQGGEVGSLTILPSSMVGSPRDMYQRYQDAMALVQKYGKPDLFITMTCNPNWIEIKNELLPGQIPNDRPDLLTRVFRSKFEELKVDIFDKSVLGRVKAHVYVIEFQKRGLPHAHILLILDDDDKLMTPDDYDLVVRAEIPDKTQEPDLHQKVVKHMIHGPCGDYNKTLPYMKTGNCKKRFPKPFSENTKVGIDSYPVYRRREGGHIVLKGNREVCLDNSWVVPYNPWLLLKYDCHINVEVCSSIESVKYLYKYVYKGLDRVSLELRQGPNYDEVKQFVDGRWISASEAFWKIFKFAMTQIVPSVERLQIHLQNQQLIRFKAHQTVGQTIHNEYCSKSMLTEFFQLNVDDPAAREFIYREIPMFYRWCDKEKKWIRRRSGQRVIGRIYTVHPSEGERFYLRILLNHIKGPISFEHLLTVDGQQCVTFKHAAEQYGLLQRDDSIRQCLLEAATYQMPATLRRLFVSILVSCEPTDVKSLWNEIYPFLCQDYSISFDVNDSRVKNSVLRDLDNILQQHGKSVSNYKDIPQLPMVTDDGSAIPKLIQGELSINISQEDLHAISNLNDDQRKSFDTIMEAVERNDNAMFFIDGPGGTGKTYLYRALLAKIRIAGNIAIATASSGIAATLLSGGRTAHSRFKISLIFEPTTTCKVEKQLDLAKLIKKTKVVIWDEAPMTNRYAFEAVSRTFIDIRGLDKPFGGIIMIFGGDFRQVLPVVQKGTRAETVASSVVKSPLWKYVRVLHLKKNMRSINDNEFAEFLLRVGDGSEPNVDDFIKIPNSMSIPWKGTESIDTLIDNIYPDLQTHINDAGYMVGRGLITPLNDDVNKINDRVISRFTGQEKIYHSFDKVENDTYNNYQQEFLNSISPGGLPPHVLRLKVGAPIMLLRNMDPDIGLCNGTRLICRSLNRNFIDAEILDGPHRGTRTFIHRIPLEPPDSVQLPFKMTRVQFPIRLSFALTINKAQGQTIPHVGIYLPDNVFSHGQLYVALSRGVSSKITKVLVAKSTNTRNTEVHTRNVVYPEVLLGNQQQRNDD